MSSELTTPKELAHFSMNMALLRSRKGWSQAEVAGKLGTARTTISNWEKGVSYPLFVDLIAITHLFEVTLNDLVSPPGVTTVERLRRSQATRDRLLAPKLTVEARLKELEQMVQELRKGEA